MTSSYIYLAYRLQWCTWDHIGQYFVESLQAVAATQTLVIGHIHVIDGCDACDPVHTHVWWVLDALQVSLLAQPHLIDGLFKYKYVFKRNLNNQLAYLLLISCCFFVTLYNLHTSDTY